jgi:cysteine desulfuration protein SufE
MSRGLKYDDLTAAEQCTYQELVRRINQTSNGGAAWSDRLQDNAKNIPEPAVHTHTSRPVGPRRFVASVQRIYDYGKRVVKWYRRPPRETTSVADLAQFLSTQAAQRGFDTVERASFPHFPAGLDPFHTGTPVERDTVAHAYPDALHHILATFREASPAQRLELLVAYAETLPELPEALQQTRDTMEQVDECATPVFLLAQLREGQVHYYIDVPYDAPTMRGFAGLLYAGLNGATPTAIAATPDNLCQQLGLQKALGALRVRGLMALLRRMKRNASDLASPV